MTQAFLYRAVLLEVGVDPLTLVDSIHHSAGRHVSSLYRFIYFDVSAEQL